MIVLLVVGLGLLAVILIVASRLSEAPAKPSCPPLKCQGPPIGNPFDASVGAPVVNGTLYRNQQGFSLRYYQLPGLSPSVATTTQQITLTYPFDPSDGGSGVLAVIGAPESDATPQGVVQDLVNQLAPGAQPVYQLPGALVGYQLGVGEAFNVQPVSSTGSTQTDRLIIMAAIKNGFVIVVIAEGQLLPPVVPGSTFWNGHPSPANLNVAYVADETVNSIRFPS